jgi:Plant transposon protein
MADSSDEEAEQREWHQMMVAAVAGAGAALIGHQTMVQAVALQSQVNAATPRAPPTLEARVDYAETRWMRMLRDKQDDLLRASSKPATDFRKNFRVPYPIFVRLCTEAEQHGWLRVAATDAAGRLSIPLELKLLAVLYVLGSGVALRTVAELSEISESSVQRALHAFSSGFCATMYDEWIKPPATPEHMKEILKHNAAVGFPGAVGSSDVTHVPWDKTPCQQARHYVGKEGFTTVAYEVTVDHTMRVQAVTRGFHGAVNDKTIVKFDRFIQRIKNDKFYTQMEFNVRVNALDAAEPSAMKRLKGAYLIVDGGYHKVRHQLLKCSVIYFSAIAQSASHARICCL